LPVEKAIRELFGVFVGNNDQPKLVEQCRKIATKFPKNCCGFLLANQKFALASCVPEKQSKSVIQLWIKIKI
jgi:hypothetical protein